MRSKRWSFHQHGWGVGWLDRPRRPLLGSFPRHNVGELRCFVLNNRSIKKKIGAGLSSSGKISRLYHATSKIPALQYNNASAAPAINVSYFATSDEIDP